MFHHLKQALYIFKPFDRAFLSEYGLHSWMVHYATTSFNVGANCVFYLCQTGLGLGINDMYCLLLLEYYGHTVLDGVGGFCIGATGESSLYDNYRA
jgi:hypothetical protein